MKVKAIQKVFHDILDDSHGVNEVDSFFYLLLEHHFKLSRFQLALDPDYSIAEASVQLFLDALERLKLNEPIQYIIGQTEFFGLPFKVNENTLIPRPETEELVQWILDAVEDKNYPFTILDIGTGSGCIAIALAKNFPNAKVFAVDVCDNAIAVAQTNATFNQVNVNFLKTNILNWKTEFSNDKCVRVGLHQTDIDAMMESFDIVVSNPPYVRMLEKEEMHANVLEHEPDLALYVEDDNPLIFYKSITEFASRYLKEKGFLFFEINQYLSAEMLSMVKTYHYKDIEIRKDMFSNERMLKAVRI